MKAIMACTFAALLGMSWHETAPATSMPTSATGLKPGAVFRSCTECPEMVMIPAGTFLMGAPAGEPGSDDFERPERRVSIREFAAGQFDVTRWQWAAFVAATKRVTSNGCAWTGAGSDLDPKYSWSKLNFEQGDDHPVVCVTWKDAEDYAQWLSARTGKKYRLLSEAEWEYAARAGTTTAFPWGSTANHENANYGTDECCGGLAKGRDRWVNTSPVGAFPANAFGLHDMQGNVLQWVEDCFSTYSGLANDGSANVTDVVLKGSGPFADMAGKHSCAFRMARGGDWGDPPAMIRSAFRNYGPGPGATLETYRSSGVGFRVAMTLE